MYKKPITKEEFIEKAIIIHNNKYDYSKVEYVNKRTKVCIICPEHGEFWQTPRNHLLGCGCFRCSQKNKSLISANKNRTTLGEFIRKAKEIHGDKYDYSKVKYINAKTKVCIICPEHGEFWQTPNVHISGGNGCPKCGFKQSGESNKDNTKSWIEKAIKIHGIKYDYSKVEYVNSLEKVCIICPKHGEFWQAPAHHLQGQGCPICAESKLEENVKILLNESKIKYEQQKKFKWLGRQRLDFYLPEYKASIECQGVQHFKCIDFFGGEKGFKYRKELDLKKKENCEKNGVKLIYFNYNEKITNLKKKLKWLQQVHTEQ